MPWKFSICNLYEYIIVYFFTGDPSAYADYFATKSTISMAIQNVELVHECFPKHLRMVKAEMKLDKATEGEKKGEYEKYSCHVKSSSDGTAIVRPVYHPQWSLLPEAVDEFPNLTLHL